jgi:hypothetical protein
MLAKAPVRIVKNSRRNAIRHGVMAATVIGALEDAEDYQTFEAVIIADYDAQSAVHCGTRDARAPRRIRVGQIRLLSA